MRLIVAFLAAFLPGLALAQSLPNPSFMPTGGTQARRLADALRLGGGAGSVATTGGTVTLTEANLGNAAIEITGALTSNVTVVFPTAQSGHWVVINKTTGAFAVSAQIIGQATTFTIPQGSQRSFGSDGALLFSPLSQALALTTPTTTVTGNLPAWGGINGQSLVDSGVAIGNGGHAVPVMDAANAWTGVQTFLTAPLFSGAANSLTFAGSASGAPVGVLAVGSDANVGLYFQPKGTGALTMTVPDNAVAGGNARGAGAVDLQIPRFSANQVASGQAATIVGGTSNIASGQTSTVLGGYNNLAGAQGAVVGGFENLADGTYSSIPGGWKARARGRYGIQCFASGVFSAVGDAQGCNFILRGSTASTSAGRLTADGAAAGSANCLNIPDNTVVVLDGMISARDTTAAGSAGVVAMRAMLARGTGAASTVATINNPGAAFGTGTGATGVSAAMTADTANGCLNVTVTPPNGDTWHWVFRGTAVEVQ